MPSHGRTLTIGQLILDAASIKKVPDTFLWLKPLCADVEKQRMAFALNNRNVAFGVIFAILSQAFIHPAVAGTRKPCSLISEYETLMLSREGLLNQWDARLVARGLTHPGGQVGLCAATCLTNLMNGLEVRNGLRPRFESSVDEIAVIINDLVPPPNMASGPRTGMTILEVEEAARRLLEIRGVNGRVERRSLDTFSHSDSPQEIRVIDLFQGQNTNTRTILLTNSLPSDPNQGYLGQTQYRHALLIVGYGRNSILASDPNRPNTTTEVVISRTPSRLVPNMSGLALEFFLPGTNIPDPYYTPITDPQVSGVVHVTPEPRSWLNRLLRSGATQ